MGDAEKEVSGSSGHRASVLPGPPLQGPRSTLGEEEDWGVGKESSQALGHLAGEEFFRAGFFPSLLTLQNHFVSIDGVATGSFHGTWVISR